MRQNTKTLIGNLNTTSNTLSVLTAQFDTKGFGHTKILYLSASTGAVTTNGVTLVETDTTSGTTNAVTGFTQGTDYTASTASNATTLAKVILSVPNTGRKRYLNVSVSHATGAIASALIAELSLPFDGTQDAAGAGAATAVGI